MAVNFCCSAADNDSLSFLICAAGVTILPEIGLTTSLNPWLAILSISAAAPALDTALSIAEIELNAIPKPDCSTLKLPEKISEAHSLPPSPYLSSSASILQFAFISCQSHFGSGPIGTPLGPILGYKLLKLNFKLILNCGSGILHRFMPNGSPKEPINSPAVSPMALIADSVTVLVIAKGLRPASPVEIATAVS